MKKPSGRKSSTVAKNSSASRREPTSQLAAAPAASAGSDGFEALIVSLPGTWDAAIPIAASRCGAVGLLDLTYLGDQRRANSEIARLTQLGRGRYGLVLHGRLESLEAAALDAIGRCDTIVLYPEFNADLSAALDACRHVASRVGVVATCEADALKGLEAGCDFLVAKGHEAGGRGGEDFTSLLLQRLLSATDRPVYAWGGVGRCTAAACRLAGAAGVALDWQLALAAESPLSASMRQLIASPHGCATTAVPGPLAQSYRLMGSADEPWPQRLAIVAQELRQRGAEDQAGWEQTIGEALAMERADERLVPLGQDALLAPAFLEYGASVGRMLRSFVDDVRETCAQAAQSAALAPGAPCAAAWGTHAPVLQRGMSGCQSPQFAATVAQAGALPVVSLDGLSAAEARALLQETKQRLGDAPLGASISVAAGSGQVADLAAAAAEIQPTLCVLDAAWSSQGPALERRGVGVLWNVSTPAELRSLLAAGQRKFFLTGRESAGPIGPLSSFVLWETAIYELLQADLSREEAEKVQVVLGGGIFDDRSAAMAATLAQPLVEAGMKLGVQVGTAYLFTQEIVETGGAAADRQQQALAAEQTAVVELPSGTSYRCAAHREQHGAAAPLLGQFLPLGQASALCSRVTSVAELHASVTTGAVERMREFAARPRVEFIEPVAAPAPLDIAIVGMSVLLPGAHDLRTYWENIVQKRDVVREVPSDRFEAARWFDAERSARDKVYSKWGGFLDDVPFDPMKYGIPPATLKSIEPAQLLALELVDRALTDAGYRQENPHKERTSLIFGAGGGIAELGAKYALRAMLPSFIDHLDDSVWNQLPEWTEDSFAGILLNVITGRVSNRFDFGGTNYTVDAACASSLGAIYLACRELADGASDMVITGGCDTVQNPFSYLCFAKSGALSPTGRSKTFDAKADGIAISEGCAAIVLKRREDAERDGDRIYAVIRGVAGASDGRSKGLTAPRAEGQMRTLERTYAQAGFSPATVGLFEAHGTGTAVGDQTECTGVTNVLVSHGAAPKSCAIGSVKSMMGHTKCTAGVAGLIKAALALHYRVLPPTMHVDSPNPKGGLVDGPLYVNSELRPWIRQEHPRRAGVSSFGFGGTNFHAVLEEYEGDATRRAPESPRGVRSAELFAFAGVTAADVAQAAEELLTELTAAINANATFSLADLAYSWHLRNAAASGPCRGAIVARNVGQFANDLHALVEHAAGRSGKKLPVGVFFAAAPLGGKTAWLFPGQGSQFPNMLREAALEFSEAAECFQRADAALAGQFDRPLSMFVFPPPAFHDAERAQARKELKMTDVAQPALGASDLATARVLEAFGLSPDMTAGHSYGELAALCVAGALDETELYRLSAARGRAIVDMCQADQGRELGQMLAVRANETETLQALDGCREVWLANLNSPKQTVISGTQAGLAEAQQRLEAAKLPHTPVPVSCGFHSPLMRPARDRFAATLREAALRAPQTTVYSNTTGRAHAGDVEQLTAVLADHLVEQVRFADEIEAMLADGATLFVEVGPGRVLTRLVHEIAGSRPHVAIALQDAQEDGLVSLLDGLAQLYVHGALQSLDRLYQQRAVRRIDLKTLATTAPAKPGRHTWLVNGSYARPADQPRRVPRPAARLAGHADVSSAQPVQPITVNPLPLSSSVPVSVPRVEQPLHPSSFPTHPAAVAASSPVNYVAPLPAPALSPIVEAPAATDDAFAQFQHTMRHFLATQETVMLAFLGAPAGMPTVVASAALTPASPMPALPAPATAPQIAAVTLAPAAALPAPQPIASPQPAVAVQPMTMAPVAPATVSPATLAQATVSRPVAVEAAALHDLLLGVVSERTGYPVDMLSLDAVLEADLGIDSIKRVEIVGAFRRAALGEAHEPPAWFMEQMSTANTLRQVLEGVTTLVAGNAIAPAIQAPAASATAARVAVSASAATADLETTLLGVVSERTGYPNEMLSLDAVLEADLGIDSIKRVEIIGAFRRAALPGLDEPPASFMEQMTTATTLRQILDGVRALCGYGAPTAAPATGASSAPAASVPVSAALSTGATGAQLEPMLLGVVSERTGYPPEMLSLDANLEADLGIDSIKRVEIVGAFRRAAAPGFDEPPAWFMEQMSSAANLQTILQGVTKLLGGDGAQTAAPPVPVAAAVSVEREAPANGHGGWSFSDSCPRCVAAVIDAPLDAEESYTLPTGAVLVTDDGGRLSAALLTAIEERGGAGVLIRAEELVSRESAAAAVERIRSLQPIAGVIHLAPLADAPAFPEIDRDAWNDRIELELRGLLFLLQAVSPELAHSVEGRFAVIGASLGGADFETELSVEARHPWRGGLSGLLRCAAKEWPTARFRAVDLDELPEPDATAGVLTVCGLLIEELTATGPTKVGYRQGRRLSVAPQRQELPQGAHAAPAIRREDVVLVTGGARGITAVVAEELARRAQPTLVLLGRSAPPAGSEDPRTAGVEGRSALVQAVLSQARETGEALRPKDVEQRVGRILAEREVRRTLQEIRAAGARVEYVSCDVRDAARLTEVVADVRQRFGEITAVIHGAGTIEDKFIVDKTAESFARVMGTKLDPLMTLVRLVDPRQLKVLMLFSSVSGFFGNPGQADYAAANEILNLVGSSLNRLWPTRVVSINWGPWSGAGMVTEAVAQQFESRGVGMVTAPAGRAVAVRELLEPHPGQTCVLYGPGPWVEEADALATAAVRHTVTTPLLAGHPVSRENDGAVTAQVLLDRRRHAYLRDHEIDNKSVLPLAVAMEMMAELANFAAPQWHVSQLSGLRLFSGVMLEDDQRTVLLRAEPIERHADHGAWRVRMSDADRPLPPLYECVVRLTAAAPVAPPAPAMPAAAEPFPLDVEQAYDQWLFHGASFQVITELTGLDRSGVDATVRPGCWRTSVGQHVEQGWLIDPLVLDAAPQLAILWSRATHDATPLPNRVGRYHRYGPIGGEPVEVRFRVENGTDGATYKANVWFIREGRVVGLMEGLEGAGSPELNRICQPSNRR